MARRTKRRKPNQPHKPVFSPYLSEWLVQQFFNGRLVFALVVIMVIATLILT